MKQYYVKLTSQVSYTAIFEAESDEDLQSIINNSLDPDSLFCEETCMELDFFKELPKGDEAEDYDLPLIKQG